MATGMYSQRISPFVLLLLFSCHFFTTPQPVSGFKIKLIHRFSKDSPLKHGNLTDQEISSKLAELSNARVQSLKSKSNIVHPDMPRPAVFSSPNSYFVQLGIGTPLKENYLLLDTGSSRVWTQCVPCDPCMTLDLPTFNPHQSSSFYTLPCDHSICQFYNYPCIEDTCASTYTYINQAETKGDLCTETFTFSDTAGGIEPVPNIIFSCGYAQQGIDLGGTASGIFGMGPGPDSFISQITAISNRFAYCLPRRPWQGTVQSFLRFSADATIAGSQQTTPLLSGAGSLEHYNLNLSGISVASVRVDFPQGSFPNGITIDSGSALTYIQRGDPYDDLEEAFLDYFQQFQGLQPFDGSAIHYNLCYFMPAGFNRFPSLTYHFQGADFFVSPEKVVDVYDGGPDGPHFCLTVLPEDDSIFGAIHQADNRVVYDIGARSVSFAPENCVGN